MTEAFTDSSPRDTSTVGMVGTQQGYGLLGFLHDGRSDTYVVLLHRPWLTLDPYVTGRVDRLTDTEWRTGHYFGNRKAAARSLVQRAGLEFAGGE